MVCYVAAGVRVYGKSSTWHLPATSARVERVRQYSLSGNDSRSLKEGRYNWVTHRPGQEVLTTLQGVTSRTSSRQTVTSRSTSCEHLHQQRTHAAHPTPHRSSALSVKNMSSVAVPKTNTQKPICVLTLDGGGIRGLSSLLLLRELMAKLSVKRGVSPADIRPAEYFDLIVGTGTGGISALFLGRMRMTVDEAIREYQRMVKASCKKSRGPLSRMLPGILSKSKIPGEMLQRVLGDIAQRVLGSRDAILGDETSCRTAVLACQSADVGAPPFLFRSYINTLPASPYTIRDVACAAVSHRGLFGAVVLGDPPVEFIDAGLLGYNNPTEVAIQEAALLWPESVVDCLVSLGTGCQRIIQLGSTWRGFTQASENIAQDCELVHHRVAHNHLSRHQPYFRFNVSHGLDSADIHDWDNSSLTGITEGYLRQPAVVFSYNDCVQMMTTVYRVNTTERSGQDIRHFMPLLNPAPECFHGREQYIEPAVEMLMGDKGVHLAILGPGGIGKTSIALAILHDQRVTNKFQEDSRFVSCEGITSDVSLVDTLCTVFGLHHLSAANRHGDLVAYLKQNYTTKPLLLILDNFETVWDVESEDGQDKVEHLLKTLGQVSKLFLAVTMRGSECPSGLQWVSLSIDTLTAEAAQQVFSDICHQKHKNSDKLNE
ncbi:FabD/lysophospholipase-like protein, partial [Ramaria rubella]